jgi:DNA polymerase II small subunit
MNQFDRAVGKIAGKGKRITVEARKLLEDLGPDVDLDGILERAAERVEGIFVSSGDIEAVLGEAKEPGVTQEITPSAEVFQPEARAMESRIKVLFDPGRRITPGETKEDFLALFRDRYKRISEIIDKRLGLKTIYGVAAAVKMGIDESTMMSGLVAGKRVIKTGVWMDVEDVKNRVSIFVSARNQETYRNARQVPLDSVIAAKVRRVNERLIIADEIYLPDVDDHIPARSDEEVYAVLTSDLHVGSTLFHKKLFQKFALWLKGKYGGEEERDMASRTKYLVIAGDLVDGVGVYPNQERELEVVSVEGQYKLAAQVLEQLPSYLEILIIPGNHDATRRALPQPPILREYAEDLYGRDGCFMLGNPVNMGLHGVNLYCFHGISLEDCVTVIPGIRQDNIAEAMKILLRVRHIAPTYGLKTRISPQGRDDLIITRAPDILHAGHTHINDQVRYRNTLVINSGTWQGQTSYQREAGLTPTPGMVPVVNLANLQLRMVRIT